MPWPLRCCARRSSGALSGSTCLVQYIGQRLHDQLAAPTRYTRHDDDVVILVGEDSGQDWWRNLRQERDVDVLQAM